MRRADRLFQIIQILRRTSRPVTGAALAAELEVSTRTVYRDVADLMAQRVPIMGEAGLGYLLATGYDMPPLMLTPVELEAMVLGAQWVARRRDPLLSTAANDVLVKVFAVMPTRLRPLIADPSTSAEPLLKDIDGLTANALVRDAIRKGMKVRLWYDAENGERTGRTVWPVTLGYSDIICVLIGWCEMRQAFRHFRTDRIHSVEMLDQPIREPRGSLLRRWEAWRLTELAARDSAITS